MALYRGMAERGFTPTEVDGMEWWQAWAVLGFGTSVVEGPDQSETPAERRRRINAEAAKARARGERYVPDGAGTTVDPSALGLLR